MTRKLRGYVKESEKSGNLSKEEGKDIRKKIRNKNFKSKSNLKGYIGGLTKWELQKDEEEKQKQTMWRE